MYLYLQAALVPIAVIMSAMLYTIVYSKSHCM